MRIRPILMKTTEDEQKTNFFPVAADSNAMDTESRISVMPADAKLAKITSGCWHPSNGIRALRGGVLLAFMVMGVCSENALAEKASGQMFENQFDIAAGGASLTRATAEGMLFANPAQLPYGGKFFRWFGLRTTFLAGKDSIDLVRSLTANGDSGTPPDEGEEADADNGSDTGAGQDFFNQVFKSPIHIGQTNALSLITNNGGFAVFSRIEPDIYAEEVGDLGVPTINFSSEAYAGAIGSFAARSPWRPLSFGFSTKYLYAAEPSLEVSLTDRELVSELQGDGGVGASLAAFNTGIGMDAGALLFLQGQSLDYRFAIKADDVGNTRMNGDAEPGMFKQVVSAGTGITFHGDTNALHLALDYRDILDAYGEKMFKKVHAGAKVTLFTYLGLAAGFYQGNPSYGAEIDLIIARIAGTLYTRELGDSPGDRRRTIYSFSLTTGVDF